MMGHEHHLQDRRDEGYFVRGPRITDAIGESLRHAYVEVRSMPQDLDHVLAALNRLPSQP
jgi:hypothetical protein